VLVDGLVERNDKQEAALLAGLIAIAIVAEATACVLSDGMYARNSGKLHRSLRLRMFDGVRRRGTTDDEESSGPTPEALSPSFAWPAIHCEPKFCWLR
jgi:hypothetical protein